MHSNIKKDIEHLTKVRGTETKPTEQQKAQTCVEKSSLQKKQGKKYIVPNLQYPCLSQE